MKNKKAQIFEIVEKAIRYNLPLESATGIIRTGFAYRAVT
jgi:hypothetical protein